VNEPGGRLAVVTGVSRRDGIGFAIARRLVEGGASVVCHSWAPHDAEQPWGADPLGPEGVVAALHAPEGRVDHIALDLAEPANPERLISRAVARFAHVDVLVVNHARSSKQSLSSVTADELDLAWAVNARASVLLVQAFAAQHDGRPGGRIVLFTSGQHRAPMSDELPYAISKGAIQQMTLSLADALADRGITVNTVNPGPTDTGWASPALAQRVARALPRGRWNTPDEIAAVVAWLVSEDAVTITGQVIDAEAGFRRSAM
jgi:NAD(P)-dependent dehydrogenase (short-subunit alcohol dehydrogenase family)